MTELERSQVEQNELERARAKQDVAQAQEEDIPKGGINPRNNKRKS